MNSTIGYFVDCTPCYHISSFSLFSPLSCIKFRLIWRIRSSCPSHWHILYLYAYECYPVPFWEHQEICWDNIRRWWFPFSNLRVVQKLEKGNIAWSQCNSPVSQAHLLSQVALQLLLCLQGNHSHWQPLHSWQRMQGLRIRSDIAKREISSLPSKCLLFFNLHYKTGCCVVFVVLLIMAESSNFSSPSELLNDLWSNFCTLGTSRHLSEMNELKTLNVFIKLTLHFNHSSTCGIIWDII